MTTIVLPNLHQMSKSNLVQAKNNGATKWLDSLPREQKRVSQEKERLSKIHVVASVQELKRTLSEIDEESISTVKKNQKKCTLIKEQIKIRKKIFQERINVPFTNSGKPRSLSVLIKDFTSYLQSNSVHDVIGGAQDVGYTSDALVGLKILHKFQVNGEQEWFEGFIISYNANTHLHKVAYDKEEENCFFNLQEDLARGISTINKIIYTYQQINIIIFI